MLDASGEPRAGFLYGNNFWLGVKTQCTDLHNKNPFQLSPAVLKNNSIYRNVNEEFPPFRVNYFAVHFRHNSTLQYHMGILVNEASILILFFFQFFSKTNYTYNNSQFAFVYYKYY